MTDDGYVFNPATGERFAFLEATDDRLRLDWTLQPGGGAPEHVHPHQVERVTGVAGELTLGFRDRTERVGPGDSIEIPAGVPHDFRNEGRDVAQTVVEFVPPGRMKEFLEMVAGLARDGKTSRDGRPRNPLQLATFTLGFHDVFHVTRPPRAVQRIALAPLAVLGRALGYRAYDPAYRVPPRAGAG
jgi:quercetin dioxygenase-like cupin family protein